MSVKNQPTNFNFLSPLGYKFILQRVPHVEYFVQRVTLPDMTSPTADTPNPFVRIKNPGDHIDFGDLSVTFKINENMDNYLEIYNWMISLGKPVSFDQYNLKTQFPAAAVADELIRSDISVIILTSGKNPNIEFKMRDCFPTALTSIDFNTTDSSIDYIEATATFAVRDYTIHTL